MIDFTIHADQLILPDAVERGMPGLSDSRLERKIGINAYPCASLTMIDLRVPAANLLGGETHHQQRAGFKGAMQGEHLIEKLCRDVKAMDIVMARQLVTTRGIECR